MPYVCSACYESILHVMCKLYENLITCSAKPSLVCSQLSVAVHPIPPAGRTPCRHWTGRCRPSSTSTSCVSRCSPARTTEPTTRRRAAEEPSRPRPTDILSSRWNPERASRTWARAVVCFHNAGTKARHTHVAAHCRWPCHSLLSPLTPRVSVQLCGYTERKPLSLQVYVGTADDRSIRPHPFYQIHRYWTAFTLLVFLIKLNVNIQATAFCVFIVWPLGLHNIA